MLILGIDTSGKTASVALSDNDRIIGQNTVFTNLTHSQIIMPMCQKLLEDCGKSLNDINEIAVSCGPGSYTGLRIGIAGVKAMAFALGIKCHGISTLESLAYNLYGFDGIICPVMKARADLVYNAVFKSENNQITRICDDRIISISDLWAELGNIDEKVIVNGDAADDFLANYGSEKIISAPPLLKNQLAGSLCISSLSKEAVSPEQLEASYLQPTKAEKERQTANSTL